MSQTPIHESVREHYAELARQNKSCCGPTPSNSCCDSKNNLYPVDLLATVPDDISSFSLGCGDPISLAELQPGQTVLDLGSGGGLDCILAAQKVGESGRVIGVDMTPEMLDKARANVKRLGLQNVEFRQGYLESLPLGDNIIDIVISNCVINLSPYKPQVFREIFRVLKPGGRVAVSDMVTNGPLPEAVKSSLNGWAACVSGAIDVSQYTSAMNAAGLVDVQVTPTYLTDDLVDEAVQELKDSIDLGADPREKIRQSIFSARVTAKKPA
jgi:SAM-dependent methyltransferase